MSAGEDIAEFLALTSFKIDTVIELLIQKGIIAKDEFKNEVYKKTEQGEDENSKLKLKKKIDELCK